MSYEIHKLSDQLVYIKWYSTLIDTETENRFLQDLRKYLDETPQPVYFISDLRQGRITNLRTIRALGQMTTHENWAGSTAFSQNPITKMLVKSFRAFSFEGESNDETQDTPEQALAFLEKLRPGLTQGIDWEAIINEQADLNQ